MKKKRRLLIYIVLFIILAEVIFLFFNSGMFSKVKKEIIKKTPDKPVEVVVIPKLKIVNEDSNSRNIAVMINNHNEARPNHAGLQDAYLVYEVVVEGGITRLMAVFKDTNTAKIGSVRSSRHYYLDYAMENDAIYVHFGYSPQAGNDIKSLRINNIDGGSSSGFWRDNTLRVAKEHKAFTNIANIKTEIAKKNYRSTTTTPLLLNYSIDEININTLEGAQIATNVSIRYSSYMKASYVYDTINKVYKRFANAKEHKDGITGLQYTAKNIIVVKIKNYKFDSSGHQGLNNIGIGDGYYITNGYAVPIKWNKTSRSGQTSYTYLNGEKIKVNDGNTYIQIQPTDQNLILSE